MSADDVAALKTIIDACGLFPPDMLADMIAPYLSDLGSERIWLTAEADGGVVGIAYCAPEYMTAGTWNLHLVAVHPAHQARGHGTALLQHLERVLTARGQRVLLVETSGLPDFERTRAFYRQRGYAEEARIRDFYQAGEDKVVFRKILPAGVPPHGPTV